MKAVKSAGKSVRLQRKRTRGWTKPAGAIYVGRPTHLGNPFVPANDGERPHCVALYRGTLRELSPGALESLLAPLRGKDLLCWCRPDQACHADVLLELANADDPAKVMEAWL